ncbi:MAG: ion transporter [Ruminococcaceae bacterium]|nr:ion transporter [Oscillospiraceae bacterium]
MRKQIFNVVHGYQNSLSFKIYKYCMIMVIVASVLSLAVKEKLSFLVYVDIFCLTAFIIDYILRWITADYKLKKKHWTSFVRFLLRPISIVDMMSIFALLSSLFGWFSGIAQVLAVFRIIRIFRYSKSVDMILQILKRSKKPLIAVGSLAVGYITVSAIMIFNIEPQSFDTIFDAIYWATVSLTTVGYGDIYPVTTLGRVVAMMSSFFGIAVVALPAGIVTAEYLNNLKENYERK